MIQFLSEILLFSHPADHACVYKLDIDKPTNVVHMIALVNLQFFF